MARGLAQVEFTLVYDDVSRRPEHFVLKEGDRVRLGRNPKLEVCFDVLRVSWLHCEFIVLRSSDGEAQLGIKDLSSNGTGLKLPGETRLRRMEKDEESPVADGLRVVIPVKSQGKKNSAEEIAKEAFVVRLGNHTNGSAGITKMDVMAVEAAAADSESPFAAARHDELASKLAMAPPPLPAFARASTPAVHTSASGAVEAVNEQPAISAADEDPAEGEGVERMEAEEEEEEEEDEQDSFQVQPPKRRRLQEVPTEKGVAEMVLGEMQDSGHSVDVNIAAAEEENREDDEKEEKADEEEREEEKQEKEEQEEKEEEKEEDKDEEGDEEDEEDDEDDNEKAEAAIRAAPAAPTEKVAIQKVAADKAAIFQAAAEEAARAAAEKAAAEKAVIDQARREAQAAELAKRKAEEATEIQKAAFEKAMSEFRSKRKQPQAKGDQAEGDEAEEDVGRRAHEDVDEVKKARTASGADGPVNGGRRILGRDVVLPLPVQQKFQSGEAMILKGGVAETSGRLEEAYEHYRLGLAVLVKEVFPSLRRTPQAASELQKQVLDYLNRAERVKATIRIQRELD